MSLQSRFPKRRVLGVEVDAVRIDEAIDHIAAIAGDRDSPPVYVVKPYVEFVDRAVRDPAVRALLDGAELSLADGVALQWAALYLDGPPRLSRLASTLAAIVIRPDALADVLPERVAGATFTWRLLERCARDGLRVHLVGSPRRHGIAATAAHLAEAIPGLQLTGASPGRADPAADGDLAGALVTARADVVLVGMGFPLQEQLMSRLCARLPHGVLIGEGGTFDYREFGGTLRRAPDALRRSGLEWAWRLVLQPSRWRRQLAIPRFVLDVHREARRLARAGG